MKGDKNVPGQRQWLKFSLIIAAVLILTLATTRVNYDDDREIWKVDSLGVLSLTCLNDRAKGLACWFYVGAELVNHWPTEQEVKPTPYPTSTPYPTNTPYPTSTPLGWQSA